MRLGDYFKGPEHKANAARLEAELQALLHQSQVDIQALQAKYDDLETKARMVGLLDLLAVQKQIRAEESLLASVQARVVTTQSDLEPALLGTNASDQLIADAAWKNRPAGFGREYRVANGGFRVLKFAEPRLGRTAALEKSHRPLCVVPGRTSLKS